ncbi:MAG: hypothetical protein RIQ81_2254 [Pseudomonadota bacterium]
MRLTGFSIPAASLALMPLMFACSQHDIAEIVNGKRKAPDIIDVIDGTSQDATLMKLYIDLTDQGFSIRVYNTPANAELFCRVDDRETGLCKHGDRFARPATGDHTFTVEARSSGKTIDSAIAKFTIRPDGRQNETIGSNDNAHPLALTVANDGFKNGAALQVSRATTFNFNFLQAPPCEKPVLRCALDSASNPWSNCDTSQYRKVIPQSLMALGSQSLYVQASCGDFSGPVLHVQWFGVPDGYQPLMPQVFRDESDQRIVELARESDCPANAVMWECRVRGSNYLESCGQGGRIESQYASRYDAVRAICGAARGPLAGI